VSHSHILTLSQNEEFENGEASQKKVGRGGEFQTFLSSDVTRNMSNIHTLRDIEQQENREPLPNSWFSSGRQSSYPAVTSSYRVAVISQVTMQMNNMLYHIF
jgi:hypothetical protein